MGKRIYDYDLIKQLRKAKNGKPLKLTKKIYKTLTAE